MHNAGAALTGIAADMSARKLEMLSQEIGKQNRWIDLGCDRPTVDVKAHFHANSPLASLLWKAAARKADVEKANAPTAQAKMMPCSNKSRLGGSLRDDVRIRVDQSMTGSAVFALLSACRVSASRMRDATLSLTFGFID
jgi:hypothetical protein